MVRVDFDRPALDGTWTAAYKGADVLPKNSVIFASHVKQIEFADNMTRGSEPTSKEGPPALDEMTKEQTEQTTSTEATDAQVEESVAHVDVLVDTGIAEEPSVEEQKQQLQDSEELGAEAKRAEQDKRPEQDQKLVLVSDVASQQYCWQGILELFMGTGRRALEPPAKKARLEPHPQPVEEAAEPDLQRALLESANEYETKEVSVAEARARLQGVMELYQVKSCPVAADGNCQFRALAHQLYSDEGKHSVVRALVVARLETSPELYADFVHEDYSQYVKRMALDGEWGDNVTLQAASDALGSEVHILTDQPGAEYLQVRPTKQTDGTMAQRALWLSFLAEVHYDAVLPL